MIPRHLTQSILKYAKEYPILALVGPRQSGKTTLAQALFPQHTYLSLENIDFRKNASEDPRGFLSDWGNHLILDEVQRVPELFSYLQEKVDSNPEPGQYILTGSHQFLLFEGISQSLAGRIVSFKLYPFTYSELKGYAPDQSLESLFQKWHPTRKVVSQDELYQLIFTGLYPRIYDRHLDSRKWVENYILTYVERDVRSLINIRNLRTYELFLKLIAGTSGQMVNYASLATSLGVSQPTIKEWLSILETSGLVVLIPPYFRNFSKRLVKTPKLYFIDTGILCYLLGIREPEQLKVHPLFGSIFETFIVSEYYKRACNLAEIPPLYFWRDKTGHEVDLIIDLGNQCLPIEIKATKTYNKNLASSLQYWLDLQEKEEGSQASKGLVVYSGDHIFGTGAQISTVPWFYL